jgi:hypothetical protein
LDPEPALTQLFCFLFGVQSIAGTVLASQIKKVCGKDHKTHLVYKLKEGTGKLCRQGY